MEDRDIIALYFKRDENAIAETDRQYGKYCRTVAERILYSATDAEECVNDTYLDAWNTMPTERPTYLGAFLSKITRRRSIDRYRHDHREKRGGIENLTDELTDCIPDGGSTPFEELERGRLREAINSFLESLPQEKRVMFVQRYFYATPISRIAESLRLSDSNVKVTLHRVRESLRRYLEEEDLL